jgi:NAD(P)-dependent dehydrogenase (short-subunit alcohol dehydrogenase family)
MARSILITGCSSGIGLETAHVLRARGWHVIAACRAADDMRALRDDGFDAVQIDYGDAAGVTMGWKAALDLAGGRLDAVFNNGGHGMSGAVEDISRAALEHVFHSNVFGLHQLTQLAARHMIAQGGGRIVQHSSVVGFAAFQWRGAYVATKHALEGLTKTMRVELRGTGVHLALLNTGPVTSGFRENSVTLFERWVDVDASRHAQFYKTVFMADRRSDKPAPFELPASSVSRRVIHAIESPRPRLRYYITVPAHIAFWVTRLLPDHMQDWIVAKL